MHEQEGKQEVEQEGKQEVKQEVKWETKQEAATKQTLPGRLLAHLSLIPHSQCLTFHRPTPQQYTLYNPVLVQGVLLS